MPMTSAWLVAASASALALMPRCSALVLDPMAMDDPSGDDDDVRSELLGTQQAAQMLVTRLGLHSELSPEELYDMMHKYNRTYELALSSRASQKNGRLPMVYLHVHKSLGTWMCKMAKLHDASVPQDADCATHDDWIWADRSWRWYDLENTCSRRTSEIRQNKWTFLEIERWIDFQDDSIHGDWCPEDAFYGMIMRDPIERAQSQMYANLQTWQEVRHWLGGREEWTNPQGYVRSHIPYDNYFVRTLCGRECHFLPPGEVTRAHLRKAKRRLEQLDMVMTVDDMLTQLPQLTVLTGWKPATQAEAEHVIHNSRCSTMRINMTECQAFHLPDNGREWMKAVNALDIELYEFAKTVAKQKTDALL